MSLHHLPARRESRPRLLKGKGDLVEGFSQRAKCHELLTSELSGMPSPPDGSGGRASSPQIKVELFSLGGSSQVCRSLPPPEFETSSATTAAVPNNGLNAVFNEKMHCLATEPNHTVLRVSVIDRDQEAAYDTLMLGALRPGYRCIELRSKSGTKIELCTLFVHIALSEANPTERLLAHKQSVIEEQERKLAEAQRVIERQADEIAELTFMRDESSRRASSLEVEQGELRALLEERERMHKAEVERLQVSSAAARFVGIVAQQPTEDNAKHLRERIERAREANAASPGVRLTTR